MSLNLQNSSTAANTAANALCAMANSGFLKIYDGAQPADGDTAVSTQTLLATLTFSATAFANAVAGVASANAIGSGTVVSAGTHTAAWFRVLKSDGVTVVFDGTVGTAGCDLNLNAVVLANGATVAVASLTYTVNKAGS